MIKNEIENLRKAFNWIKCTGNCVTRHSIPFLLPYIQSPHAANMIEWETINFMKLPRWKLSLAIVSFVLILFIKLRQVPVAVNLSQPLSLSTPHRRAELENIWPKIFFVLFLFYFRAQTQNSIQHLCKEFSTTTFQRARTHTSACIPSLINCKSESYNNFFLFLWEILFSPTRRLFFLFCFRCP